MKYPKEYLEEIKKRLKVSEVVGKFVKLKRRGKEFVGLSPFSNEIVWYENADSPNLIFHNTQDMFHHSIETDIEGNIWAPSHLYPQSLSSEKVGRNIISDDGYYDDAIL